MGLVRNSKTNVSVSSSHNYTKEKVEAVGAFLTKYGKNQRNTPIQEIVDFYNEIRGTNERVSECKKCGLSKYIVQLQNYYKYGRLILQNQGVEINEAKEEPQPQPIENESSRINLGSEAIEVVEEPEQPEQPDPIEEPETIEVAEPIKETKPKGRPKKTAE